MTSPTRHRIGTDVDPTEFKQVLTRFPSGVTVVTTTGANRTAHGFTATAFTSVSLDPPLIAVFLARSARSHHTFSTAPAFTVNLLRPEHIGLAERFASKVDDKFADGGFRADNGELVVDDALGVLSCTAHAVQDLGDHTMLVGRVWRTESSAGAPLVYYDREFHRIGGTEC